MFRNSNTKTMLFALVILLALVVGVYLSDRSKGERTFKEYLVQTDASAITHIQLLPKALKGKQIDLKKEGSDWTVSQNEKSFPADQNAAERLISSLDQLKPESVVSSNPDRWKAFELTDSLATRVKLMNGTRVVADLLIGKIEMSSNRNAISYVRLANDKVVYSLDGFLSMDVNRNLDSFRNRKVVEGSKADWSKLEFSYPADSSFVLEKQTEGKWHIGATEADPVLVDKFLDALQNLSHSKFAAQLPPSKPIYSLKIEGNKLAAPVEVNGYLNASGNLVISSSLNNGNLFDGEDLMEKVFPAKKQFFKN